MRKPINHLQRISRELTKILGEHGELATTEIQYYLPRDMHHKYRYLSTYFGLLRLVDYGLVTKIQPYPHHIIRWTLSDLGKTFYLHIKSKEKLMNVGVLSG